MSEVQANEVEAVEKKSKKAPKEKVEKVIQNSVVRPKAGTKTARVWEIAEELSNAAGTPAKRADVMKQADAEGINAATVATQIGKWRKFHGIIVEKVAKEEAVAE